MGLRSPVHTLRKSMNNPSGSAHPQPVLSFPVLAGMSYPRLESASLMRVVADAAAIIGLPSDQREQVRVLMTSATRGCSAQVAEVLPNLRLVVSQGAGQDKIDVEALRARGVRVR